MVLFVTVQLHHHVLILDSLHGMDKLAHALMCLRLCVQNVLWLSGVERGVLVARR